MDRTNVRTMVNLTGGFGQGLTDTIARFDRAHPGRFLTFTEPRWSRLQQPGFGAFQAEELGRAQQAGARGLKVLKSLGLVLRENGATGPLVKVDDRRFDPMWETCAALKHAGCDPRRRSRGILPAHRPLQRAVRGTEQPPGLVVPRRRLPAVQGTRGRARPRRRAAPADHVHRGCTSGTTPRTSPPCPSRSTASRTCSSTLAARIGELGRQPRTVARISSSATRTGSCSAPTPSRNGDDTPQQVFGERLYQIYFRFLETEDEYFDYAPAPVPPQGRWQIYGLGLPDAILRKVYAGNAARLLGIDA